MIQQLEFYNQKLNDGETSSIVGKTEKKIIQTGSEIKEDTNLNQKEMFETSKYKGSELKKELVSYKLCID